MLTIYHSMQANTNMVQATANPVLARWNELNPDVASREVLPCCGSQRWAQELAALRPLVDAELVYAASDRVWHGLSKPDWQQAFDSHPRIGENKAHAATPQSLRWSAQEQKTAVASSEASDTALKLALVEENRRYEAKFGHIFIVCASGRSSGEILSILKARMERTAAEEWLEAGEQQRQITQLRLRRWLGEV